MKIEKIKHEDAILALAIRGSDWEKGLNFVSEEQDFIQVGIWKYEKGKKLLAHKHIEIKREASITQEVLFIKKGKIKADIYSEKDKLVKSIELGVGDTLVCLKGGHGYEIIDEDTEVLEVKNGPYVGAEQDRKRLFE
jgi:hypothetical protein